MPSRYYYRQSKGFLSFKTDFWRLLYIYTIHTRINSFCFCQRISDCKEIEISKLFEIWWVPNCCLFLGWRWSFRLKYFSQDHRLKSANIIAVDKFNIRRVATCMPGKPGPTSFSKTLALFFIQFVSFRKMKVRDGQNENPGLPEKSGWLRAWMCYKNNSISASFLRNWNTVFQFNSLLFWRIDFFF